MVDTVKRIKSLPVMKNSLEKFFAEVREVGDSKPEPKKVEEPKKTEKPTKKEETAPQSKSVRPADDEITGAIVTFLEMIKARPGNSSLCPPHGPWLLYCAAVEQTPRNHEVMGSNSPSCYSTFPLLYSGIDQVPHEGVLPQIR